MLETKLFPPSRRPGHIRRRRLLSMLDAGLEHGRGLSLICAPAGYGKSVLASQWIGEQHRAAWLSLDEGDNDFPRFLSCLIAALGIEDSVQSEIHRSLHMPQLPAPRVLASHLVRAVGRQPQASTLPFTLVLEDYHHIHLPKIHEMIQALLDHRPRRLHLVITTREDPPLSLARMRAQGELTEIRVRELRFTTPETTRFLCSATGRDLQPDWVNALKERTEGWITGLHLAALSIKGHEGKARIGAALNPDTVPAW